MRKIGLHYKFAIRNHVVPSHLDFLAYCFNVIVFAILVFFSFQEEFYIRIKKTYFLQILDLSNEVLTIIMLLLLIFVLVSQLTTIMTQEDVVFLRSIGFERGDIRILFFFRMLPLFIISIFAFALKRVSLQITTQVLILLIIFTLLSWVGMVEHRLSLRRQGCQTGDFIMPKSKWGNFVSGEILSNKGYVYFSSFVIIGTMLSVLIGHYIRLQFVFFLVIMIIMYGLMEDIFFYKRFKMYLYESIGLTKCTYYKYCCFFCNCLYIWFYGFYFIGGISCPDMDYTKEISQSILLILYGIICINSHVAVCLLLHNITNNRFVKYIYIFAFMFPVIPLIVIIKARSYIKLNSSFIE